MLYCITIAVVLALIQTIIILESEQKCRMQRLWQCDGYRLKFWEDWHEYFSPWKTTTTISLPLSCDLQTRLESQSPWNRCGSVYSNWMNPPLHALWNYEITDKKNICSHVPPPPPMVHNNLIIFKGGGVYIWCIKW